MATTRGEIAGKRAKLDFAWACGSSNSTRSAVLSGLPRERRARQTAAPSWRMRSTISRRKTQGIGDGPVAFGLGDIVRRAERERLQADFGVSPRQGRRHDDDEIGLGARAGAAARRGPSSSGISTSRMTTSGLVRMTLSTASRPLRKVPTLRCLFPRRASATSGRAPRRRRPTIITRMRGSDSLTAVGRGSGIRGNSNTHGTNERSGSAFWPRLTQIRSGRLPGISLPRFPCRTAS